MEDDVVFTDEIDDAAFGVFPIFFPRVGKKFLCVGDVADRRVKPYVENLALRSFHGNWHTPFKVAADGAWLESGIEP